MLTYTHCGAPPHPLSTTTKPHVSVGINRSVQSSSHPAFKSFLEVVLQKPSAEQDKCAAVPQAQCLLNCLVLSLLPPPSPPFCTYPHFPSIPHYFYPPAFPKHSMFSVTLFVPTFFCSIHVFLSLSSIALCHSLS